MIFSNFWSLWPYLPKFGKILPKSKCEETESFFVKISELFLNNLQRQVLCRYRSKICFSKYIQVKYQKGISPIMFFVGIWYHLAWKRCLEDTRWLWCLMRGLRFRWLFGQSRNAIIPRRMAELRATTFKKVKNDCGKNLTPCLLY